MSYKPLLDPQKKHREATVYSVTIGLVMTIIFSAAAAYLGLKVGQVFEAAIPIAIIAVGLSSALKRKNSLGENVIIQSIGACSGGIVAGAIFTLPALYILQAKYPEIQVDFIKVFLSSLLGGVLGILFLIPFRKYFVKEMDGKYPFPEATATTQVIKSGEGDSGGARILLISGLIGGLYDFIVSTFGWWSETIYTTVTSWGTFLADKAKLLVKYNVGAAVMGLGYIIGLKYAFIICCGSMLVWFIIIPLLSALCGAETVTFLGTTFEGVSNLGPQQIFTQYARHIGIGGIAVAGIIGIIKSSGVIKSAVGLATKSFKKQDGEANQEIRTQRDMSMKIIVIGLIAALLATFIFFYFGVIPDTNKLLLAIVALLIVTIIAFLFTTVAANAIAIVGSNPVSGMTLMTLILGSVVLVACGLKGVPGMVASLIIGGVVCTALSVAGSFITDLKIGYWIGTTPKVQEHWKFIGTLVAAATVGGVMIVLNQTYGFVGDNALVAPQANAMAAVIEPLMSGGGAPWLLYGIGAIIALVLNFCGVPALAFALGMFIPIDLNLPLLAGGAIAWYVGTRSKDKEVNEARSQKGTLIASGFIAGGALMGVVSAILRFAGKDYFLIGWAQKAGSQYVGIVAYLALAIFLISASLKISEKKKQQ